MMTTHEKPLHEAPLPDVFDEFSEQRKNSFLQVKALKESGVPIVGTFCSYFPKEIAQAMGAVCVGLCSMSEETIPDAERDLPKNLCPLIKASYGFAVTDKCPFFYFSDLIVGETTCDGKKKMYEYLGEIKNVYVMQLPQQQTPEALQMWKREILRLKSHLQDLFHVTIGEDEIRAAVGEENRLRRSIRSLYGIMRHEPAPILGGDLFKVLYGSQYKLDRKGLPEELDALKARIEKEYAEGKRLDPRPRILITGCPMGGTTEKLLHILEENGAVVVAFENCSGAKAYDELVDEDTPDIYEAIARRYLNIGCSVMSPDSERMELLGRLIDDFQVDGVVEMTLTACLTYAVETRAIRRFVTEEKKLPYLHVETDYSHSDVGQLSTRLAAFLEML